MPRSFPALSAVTAALMLTACQQPVESAPQSKAPAIEALGPAVSCIQTSRIRDTEVHDDQTIDFNMLGGGTFRNTLPNRCPSLGFSVDVIAVLYSDGQRGAGCGLGPFLPVKINKD
jgi:hypothetical protein